MQKIYKFRSVEFNADNKNIFAIVLVVLLLTTAYGKAAENIFDNRTWNEGIYCVPTPGKVIIDGSLDDWDWTGRIISFSHTMVRNRYSAEYGMMWNENALFFAAKIKDPTPMRNNMDVQYPQYAWRSDSIILRVLSGDQNSLICLWFNFPEKRSYFYQSVWKDKNERNGIRNKINYHTEPGQHVLGDGLELKFKINNDRRGYTMESKIPWRYLFQKAPEITPETLFRMLLSVTYGAPDGSELLHSVYADNVRRGLKVKCNIVRLPQNWGEVRLLSHGNLEPRRYKNAGNNGFIPVTAEIPANATRFTLAINDETGKRVRNLAGDYLPEDFTSCINGKSRAITVMWDALDDDGKPIRAGTYNIVGLSHEGLKAEYEMCFYTPGTPPWRTASGNGAWGADLSNPIQVTSSNGWKVISWHWGEHMRPTLIGVGPDGLKKWWDICGGAVLASDDKYVYIIPSSTLFQEECLIRKDIKTGLDKPFKNLSRKISSPYFKYRFLLRDALQDYSRSYKKEKYKLDKNVSGMAVHDNMLAIAVRIETDDAVEAISEKTNLTDKNLHQKCKESCLLGFLNKETGKLIKKISIPSIASLAFNSHGELFGIHENSIVKINYETGELIPINTPTFEKASAITIDKHDNILVADTGADSQVKAYTTDGNLVYTCGKKGGRPIRGKFNPQAMMRMNSIAYDEKENHVWVVESWEYPRRVSVWKVEDGSLATDYIGDTGYNGAGAYLHDEDPALGYVGPVEIGLDKERRKWKVKEILWVPEPGKGENFRISTISNVPCQRFSANVDGVKREYLFKPPPSRPWYGYVIYMERNDKWQPVSAICTAGIICGKIPWKKGRVELPQGELNGCGAFDAVFWNDTNEDGILQRNECEIIPERKDEDSKVAKIPVPMKSGWGERINKKFIFYSLSEGDIYRYKPIKFTANGAPVYTSKSVKKLGNISDCGPIEDIVPLGNEKLLLRSKGGCGSYIAMADAKNLNVEWRYPNPTRLHKDYPMPNPGLLIQVHRILGIARPNEKIGDVFAMRGKVGEDYFLTAEDGLYIGSMFTDRRLPFDALPDTEQMLVGYPMEYYSHRDEAFSGWFGKQNDGKIRLTTGFARQGAMILQINGIDTIKRLNNPDKLFILAEDVEKAQKIADERKRKTAEHKHYVIRTVNASKFPKAWNRIQTINIGDKDSLFRGLAQITFDHENLYLRYRIQDESPWMNNGKLYTHLFKTGDAVDLFLNVNPSYNEKERLAPEEGDIRLLIAQLGDKPVAVIWKPVDGKAAPEKSVLYTSPAGAKKHDCVEIIDAEIRVNKKQDSYIVEAAIPLKELGLNPYSGLKIKGDVGFISSDKLGGSNVARSYWANTSIVPVSDIPSESWFFPQYWGEFTFK